MLNNAIDRTRSSVAALLVCTALASGCGFSGCESPRDDSTGAGVQQAAPPTAEAKSELDGVLAKLSGQLADESSREEAMAGLVALGPVALPALATALENPDVETRLAAVAVLAEIGTPKGVDLLLGAIDDADDAVRFDAVEALGAVPDRRAVAPLLARYEVEPDSAVRYEILTTLGPIGDPGTVDFLVAKTSDQDRYVRMWAADALCVMKAAPAAERALALASDGDLYVRMRILAACSEQLDTPQGRDRLIEIVLGSDNFEEVVGARRNLEKYLQTGSDAEALRAKIVTAAKPALEGEHAMQAAFLLADANDASGVPLFIEAMKSPDVFVRHHAAHQLGRLGKADDVVPVLIAALSDDNTLVAATAHDSLLGFANKGDARAKAAVDAYSGATFDQKLPDNPTFCAAAAGLCTPFDAGPTLVTPAKAGVHLVARWIPAFETVGKRKLSTATDRPHTSQARHRRGEA